MRNHQKATADRGPDGYVSIFLVGMIRIINCDAQAVFENRSCLTEGDIVLQEVCFSFVKIPFEVDHDLVLLHLGLKPGTGVNLWGISPLYANPVNVLIILTKVPDGGKYHLAKMPRLANPPNSDLKRRFTVPQVAEKHCWQEPLV
jgi:hypothetical protein